MLAELRPVMLELSKSSYAHFTVIKLISLAPRKEVSGEPAALSWLQCAAVHVMDSW